MDAVSYSVARAHLASTMDRVCQNHEPILVTRSGGQPSVVMLSLEDFESLQETAYLLRSPRNARRLLDAIDALGAGQGRERTLIDDTETT